MVITVIIVKVCQVGVVNNFTLDLSVLLEFRDLGSVDEGWTGNPTHDEVASVDGAGVRLHHTP